VIREIAGHDPGRYREVLKWPIGEALKSYEFRLRQQARQEYHAAVQVWAVLAATGATKQKKPPEPPAILKE
jgi:hypothetical protein